MAEVERATDGEGDVPAARVPGGGIPLRRMPAEASPRESTYQVADHGTTVPYLRIGGPDFRQEGNTVDKLLRHHT